jgi:hypothetical protein
VSTAGSSTSPRWPSSRCPSSPLRGEQGLGPQLLGSARRGAPRHGRSSHRRRTGIREDRVHRRCRQPGARTPLPAPRSTARRRIRAPRPRPRSNSQGRRTLLHLPHLRRAVRPAGRSTPDDGTRHAAGPGAATEHSHGSPDMSTIGAGAGQEANRLGSGKLGDLGDVRHPCDRRGRGFRRVDVRDQGAAHTVGRTMMIRFAVDTGRRPVDDRRRRRRHLGWRATQTLSNGPTVRVNADSGEVKVGPRRVALSRVRSLRKD